MYQALYRKYRPKKLSDVVGQDIIVKILKNSIKNNQINHAYLFCGPRGTGKTSIAKILAKTINCSNLNNFEPCDTCENCIEFNNKTSTDIIEIDAASNNGVDEIRELKNKINLVPNIGKYKVYIIDEVHMLTIGAFNALLKTLEEPPKHAIFILATTEPHKIPITILSRCQKFDFKKIDNLSIINRLVQICELEKIDIENNALQKIALLSDGGMRDSLSMLDKLVAYADGKITEEDVNEINGIISNSKIKDFIENMYMQNYKVIFDDIDSFNSSGKDFVKLSEELMKYLRNNLVDSLSKKNELAEKLGKNKVIKYIESFNDIIMALKNSSNQKIIFETNIIKLISDTDQPQKIINDKSEREPKKMKIDTFTPNIKQQEVPDATIKLLDQLKKIRINNTLSKFNKKILIELNAKQETIKNYLLDPDYSEVASLILDGKIKAASENHIIFVYDSENIELNFNLKIPKIEKLLELNGLPNYNVVATNMEEWTIIKEEFNSKTKKYFYEDDSKLKNEIFQIQTDEKNSIENMFNDIIEYEK